MQLKSKRKTDHIPCYFKVANKHTPYLTQNSQSVQNEVRRLLSYSKEVKRTDIRNIPPRPGPKLGIVELCPVLPVLLLPTLVPPLPSPVLLLPLVGELCVLDWGAQGFGKGSLFSVREGWLSPPEDGLLTKEANGLPPNYKRKVFFNKQVQMVLCSQKSPLNWHSIPPQWIHWGAATKTYLLLEELQQRPPCQFLQEQWSKSASKVHTEYYHKKWRPKIIFHYCRAPHHIYFASIGDFLLLGLVFIC